MVFINDLPAELILNIARYLDDADARQAWDHVGNFVLTNRKHYSIVNSFLYGLAPTYRFPVFWAAQNGMTTTLQMLLQAGARSLNTFEWMIDHADFPTEYRLGLWAGRCQSVNALIGVIDDDLGQAEPEAMFCSRLRLSGPFLDRDTCFFGNDGTIKPATYSELRLIGDYDQPTRTVGRGRRIANVAWSPLHAAAANGHVGTMKILIENGATIDDWSSGYCWCRPMPTWHHARSMVRDGEDGTFMDYLNERNEEGAPEWTPLHHAICHGHTEAAVYLIEQGASCFLLSESGGSSGGVTALHTAAGAGCLEVVQYLIKERFQNNIDILDSNGMTPLHWACRNGQFTAASWLVDHGADVNHICVTSGNPMLVDFIEHGLNEHALKLLELGAGPNIIGEDGCTPLHMACGYYGLRTYESDLASTMSQRHLLIEMLLDADADVYMTMVDEDEMVNPLEFACIHHNAVAVECLLLARADSWEVDEFLDARNCVQSCLDDLGHDTATLERGLRILELLVEHASGLDPPPINTITVFQDALMKSIARPSPLDDQIFRTLLTRAVDFQDTGAIRSAVTCFELALRKQRFEICDTMLRRGFQPTADEIKKFWSIGLARGLPDVLEYVLDINRHGKIRDEMVVDAVELKDLLNAGKWEIHFLERFLLNRKLLNFSNSSIPELNLALAEACIEQSAVLAKHLIDAGAEVNSPFSAAGPVVPLLILVQNGDTHGEKHKTERREKILSLLLQSGADILHQADFCGAIGEAERALMFRVGGNCVSTPVGYAVACHDNRALELMFHHNPGILSKDARAAKAPYLPLVVLQGLRHNTDRVVTELVRNGADPMAPDPSGDIALAGLLDYYDLGSSIPCPPRGKELVIPQLLRMLWHEKIDVNRTNSSGLSIGDILSDMLQWQESTSNLTGAKSRDAQLRQLSLELGKHIQVTKIGDDKYSAQLRPIQETLSQRLLFHGSLGD